MWWYFHGNGEVRKRAVVVEKRREWNMILRMYKNNSMFQKKSLCFHSSSNTRKSSFLRICKCNSQLRNFFFLSFFFLNSPPSCCAQFNQKPLKFRGFIMLWYFPSSFKKTCFFSTPGGGCPSTLQGLLWSLAKIFEFHQVWMEALKSKEM